MVDLANLIIARINYIHFLSNIAGIQVQKTDRNSHLLKTNYKRWDVQLFFLSIREHQLHHRQGEFFNYPWLHQTLTWRDMAIYHFFTYV